MPLQKVSVGTSAAQSLIRAREKSMVGKTYRRAKLIWQVKHLNGFTLVSARQKVVSDSPVQFSSGTILLG